MGSAAQFSHLSVMTESQTEIPWPVFSHPEPHPLLTFYLAKARLLEYFRIRVKYRQKYNLANVLQVAAIYICV